jgi:acetylornithine/succinyldiaminopimelate/putrescine aminotransferase
MLILGVSTVLLMSSGYSLIGAPVASRRVMEQFLLPGASFWYGCILGGHPVSAGVTLANLDLLDAERLYENVVGSEALLQSALEKARELAIVGDVRGDGYFRAIELVKDRAAKASFNTAERAAVATMSGPGWLGFVVGPPLIGYFGDAMGLTSALWVLPAFMVTIAVVVRRHPVFRECHRSQQAREA